MSEHGVRVQRFFVASTAKEAQEAAKRLSELFQGAELPPLKTGQGSHFCSFILPGLSYLGYLTRMGILNCKSRTLNLGKLDFFLLR